MVPLDFGSNGLEHGSSWKYRSDHREFQIGSATSGQRSYQASGRGILSYPVIRISSCCGRDVFTEVLLHQEDDEFYLEWIFDNFRFGFDFFEDESQSGWFIVMGGGDEMFRSGSTFDGDYSRAVRYALDVIAGGYDPISSAHSV